MTDIYVGHLWVMDKDTDKTLEVNKYPRDEHGLGDTNMSYLNTVLFQNGLVSKRSCFKTVLFQDSLVSRQSCFKTVLCQDGLVSRP